MADVRQGEVLSTAHYKRYNNPLLLHLEDAYSEVKIGSINITHITVADDLAVLPRNKRSRWPYIAHLSLKVSLFKMYVPKKFSLSRH